MFNHTVLCVPRSQAIRCTEDYLLDAGLHLTRTAAPDVTHVLLPVPSFPYGDEYLAHILADLPDNVIISGGNLTSPLLKNYAVVDFLQDPYYLAENAAITADCTLKIIKSKFPEDLHGCPVLVIGWGRIGKCLCRLLENHGTDVTVAARKGSDRAMIRALGGNSISIECAAKETSCYDIIINTVPVMVLPNVSVKNNALVLELASKPGISCNGIQDCRGLPGKMAPEESGKLIAETFIRLLLGEERKL